MVLGEVCHTLAGEATDWWMLKRWPLASLSNYKPYVNCDWVAVYDLDRSYANEGLFTS